MRRIVWCVCLASLGTGPALADEGSPLGTEIQGAIVYAREGRIKKVVLGRKDAVDLGEGACARFSPDGKRLAVYKDRRVHVMDADGRNRRQVLEGADWPEDGCAVEFHANGREILYVRKNDGLWSVDIASGRTTRLDLPGRYTGEISMTADGKRLTARWGHDLYAVDLVARTHRKFAKGCSPGVSPDGKLLVNNTGGHHDMVIRPWDGGDSYKVSGRDARPDGSWDDFHWSNHPDLLVAAGDRRDEESYVVRLSDRRVFRASWEGRTRFPDLHVTGAGALAARPRSEAARATPESGAASDPSRRDPGTDRSRPAEKPARITGAWPGSAEGLIWLWEDATRPNEVRTGGRRAPRACRVEAHDAARFTRHHGMDLAGGGFVAEDLDAALLEAIRRNQAFSFEAVVTTPDGKRDRKGSRIVSLGEDFVLRDGREDLRVLVRTASGGGEEVRETVLGTLPAGAATHVVISYRPGLLAYHADGQEVFRTELKGDLRAFRGGKLVFGAAPGESRSWRGALDSVALYARFVGAAEAAQKFALLRPRLAQRSAPPRFTFRGRVLEVSPIPEPRSLEPYRRALVTTTYEVIDGAAPGGARKVQVASWAILDGRVVRRTARIRVGDERSLAVEPFDAHPQLESERLLADSADPDLPLLYDPRPVDRDDLTAWAAQHAQARPPSDR